MDGGRFDNIARHVTACGNDSSRRGVLRALAGGALATALAVFDGPEAAEARRKQKKKQRCGKIYQRCNGHKNCCSKKCCFVGRGRRKFCATKTARCCPRPKGGGACRNNGSCCGPKPGYPRGSCCPRTRPNCCPGNVLGCCPVGFPACFGPSELNPNGLCCQAGAVPCEEAGWCCYPNGLSVQSAMGAVPSTQGIGSANGNDE